MTTTNKEVSALQGIAAFGIAVATFFISSAAIAMSGGLAVGIVHTHSEIHVFKVLAAISAAVLLFSGVYIGIVCAGKVYDHIIGKDSMSSIGKGVGFIAAIMVIAAAVLGVLMIILAYIAMVVMIGCVVGVLLMGAVSAWD